MRKCLKASCAHKKTDAGSRKSVADVGGIQSVLAAMLVHQDEIMLQRNGCGVLRGPAVCNADTAEVSERLAAYFSSWKPFERTRITSKSCRWLSLL